MLSFCCFVVVVMRQESTKKRIICVIHCQPVSQSQSLQLLSADPVKTFFVSPLIHVKKHFCQKQATSTKELCK